MQEIIKIGLRCFRPINVWVKWIVVTSWDQWCIGLNQHIKMRQWKHRLSKSLMRKWLNTWSPVAEEHLNIEQVLMEQQRLSLDCWVPWFFRSWEIPLQWRENKENGVLRTDDCRRTVRLKTQVFQIKTKPFGGTHLKEHSSVSWRPGWSLSRGSCPCACETWPRKTTRQSRTSTWCPASHHCSVLSPVCCRQSTKETWIHVLKP